MILFALLGCPSPTAETGQSPTDTAPAALSVGVDALDFGAVPRDCTAEPQTISVGNTGEASLEISDAVVEGNGASAFSIAVPQGRIDGGQSADIAVTFTPSAWYDYDLTLAIQTTAGAASVALTGSGIAGESIEEQATLTLASHSDVLLLVDHTESMNAALSAINSAMPTFWDALTRRGTSIHLGALTMDMEQEDHSGRLQGIHTDADTAPILPDADSLATEQGLAALMAALSEPLLSVDNADFRRDGVPLSVIVFSNEDDDSNLNPAEVESWLLAQSGATLHAMVEARKPDQACETEPGGRYLDLMAATGGEFASICTEDTEAALVAFADAILGLRSVFPLTAMPDSVDGITVLRNSAVVSQSLEDGWTFDTAEVAIRFHGESIPDVGDTLTFSYTTTICL